MSSSWSPECLRRSIDEVRALSSMYGDGSSLEEDPTEVVHHESLLDEVESLLDHGHAHVRSVPALEVTVRLLGARLRGGGVDVAVRLPPGYPASCRAEVQVQGNARVTVDDLRKIHQVAERAMFREVGDGEETAVAGVEAVRSELTRMKEIHAVLEETHGESERERCAKEQSTQNSDLRKASGVARRLIWFHHIKAPSKRKAARVWAKELSLGGFVKPGYPGVIVIEGNLQDAEEYVKRLKQLTWKAMSVRVAEEEGERGDGEASGECGTTVSPLASRRLSSDFRELPENGLGEMGQALRQAGLEHLLDAALKQRTFKWTGGANATDG